MPWGDDWLGLERRDPAMAIANINLTLPPMYAGPGRPMGGMSFNPINNPINNQPFNPVFNPTISGGNQALSPYMPNINGGMLGGFGGGGIGYGGGATLSPYPHGGYPGYMPGVGDLGSCIDPWEYYDPDYINAAYALGYISVPQYNQYILMLGDRSRRRSMWPCLRGRDRYRFMIGPGIGYGGLGRRGWMSAMGMPTY